jgi:acetyl-CoA acetyltransferase family protein
MPKAKTAFARTNEVHDTTIGWRFINPKMQQLYETHSMPETADNVANDYKISRADQDAFALRSQERWAKAQENKLFDAEIIPVSVPQRRGDDLIIDADEHPRPDTDIEKLGGLRTLNGPKETVTAGNASGVNDGAAAILLANNAMAQQLDLQPIARVLGTVAAGVPPRVMGIGPVPAVKKLLAKTGLRLEQMDVIELNEAFSAQAIAVLRELGLEEDADHINPNGGAIALGHPLGMSGARLVASAAYELRRRGGKYALCTMCVGGGQGIATIIENVS